MLLCVVQLFEYPSQRLQDWLSQRWVMATGSRIEPEEHSWLYGPFGEVDEIADNHIQRLADAEGLEVVRRSRSIGLYKTVAEFLADESMSGRLHPVIRDFYERTADYDLDVWSEWSRLFGPGGRLIRTLYSRRLRQLDLPQRPLDTSHGISSEIIRLIEPDSGETKYTVWHRTLMKSGQVLYSGHYGACDTPRGVRCAKVVFPLPCGNATVVLKPSVDESGNLELVSCGERSGDPGFYFLLRDRKGRHWMRYIRSFRERIFVYVDPEGNLRADHELSLWRRRVLTLHYRARPVQSRVVEGEAT